MSKKNNDNNETIQMIEISEGFIRWLMMNHLGKIYETERFYKILKDEMNNQFNIKCYDVTIGFRNDQDIFSEINNKEMIFTHGLISILLKCHQLKILIQGKGVTLENKKSDKNFIMIYSIGNVFIK